MRVSARASVLLLVVMLAATLSVAPLRTYLSQRERLAELRRQAAALEAQNRELEREVGRLNDPVYLERLARECLGMTDPGEIAFVTIPERGKPHPPEC
jgi:cell division protein FtsB